jgi:hypothetical protein
MGNAKKNQGIEYLATGKSAEEAVRKLREMEKEGVQEDPYKIEYTVKLTPIGADTQLPTITGNKSTESGKAYDQAMAKSGCKTLLELTGKYEAHFNAIGTWYKPGQEPVKARTRASGSMMDDTTKRTQDLTHKLF